MLASSLSEVDGSVWIVDCGRILPADSCPTLRLLWPVAARLGLSSLPVVEEDGWEVVVVGSESLLSPSCLRVEVWGGTVSDASRRVASG
jgi:hypothetical protein